MNAGSASDADRLVDLAWDELRGDAPPGCDAFVAEIRGRFGGAVAAVLFYGSCLRESTDDGVLDFYALVDDYRSAYGGGALAWWNERLPPNVFYLESGGRRAKVAVLSTRDFRRGVLPRAIRPGIWARFSQPFAAAHVRDDGAREQVAAGAADAITTAVTRALGLVAHASGVARTRSDALWVALFRETYASELRPESEDRADRIVQRDPDRYARALELALARLAAAGRLAFEREGDAIVVRDAPELLGRRRRLRRSAARAIGVLQLLKTAFTFGDWMPYALWKLERHTGTRLEPTERQLRHPLLFGWPLILRVLVKRELR